MLRSSGDLSVESQTEPRTATENSNIAINSSEQDKKTYRRCELYLIPNGSRLELKVLSGCMYCYDPFKATNVHPLLLEAKHCNTYEKVLALLEGVKKNPECNVKLYYADISHFLNARNIKRIEEPNIDVMIDRVKSLQKQEPPHYICTLS